MIQRPPEVHGAAFDLLVVGGNVFAGAVARDAAASGLRTLLVAPGDLGAGGRTHGWLARCLAADATDAFRIAAFAEREQLLRRAPHLARPVRALVAAAHDGAGDVPRRVRRVAALAARTTLPAPQPCEPAMVRQAWPQLAAAGPAVLAFDAVVDAGAVARSLARAAVAAGAVCWTHAQVERTGLDGIEIRAPWCDRRAQVRAAVTIATEAFAAMAATFRVDVAGRLAPAPSTYAEAPPADGDFVRIALGRAGVFEAGPGAPPVFGWWRAHDASGDAATFRVDLPALAFDAGVRHGVLAPAVPTQTIDEPVASGRLLLQAASPLRALQAARELVARVAPSAAGVASRPWSGDAGPHEPLDPLWQRHGADAARVRRMATADARMRVLVCPHRGVLAAEVAHALHADGAVCFADVVRRLFATSACRDPECLGRAHGAYLAIAGEPSDADPATATRAAQRALAAAPIAAV